jgi:hypothetical protein
MVLFWYNKENVLEYLSEIIYCDSSWILSFTSQDQDDNDLMAYWLSNTSALLFLLEQSLKSGSSTNAASVGKPPNPTSLFGRMTMVINIYIF